MEWNLQQPQHLQTNPPGPESSWPTVEMAAGTGIHLPRIPRRVRAAISRTATTVTATTTRIKDYIRDRLAGVVWMTGGAGDGSDPLRLLGAGILGALAQWLFNRVVKRALPPGNDDKRVLSELKHIRAQIQIMQGDLRGLSARVGALERGGGD